MTDKKCPKCKSRTFQICSEFVQDYIYEVKDGFVEAEGAGDGGDHVRTSCHCRKCGHTCHPRKFNFTIDE